MNKQTMHVAESDIKTRGWFWYLMEGDKKLAMNGPFNSEAQAQAAADEFMQSSIY